MKPFTLIIEHARAATVGHKYIWLAGEHFGY